MEFYERRVRRTALYVDGIERAGGGPAPSGWPGRRCARCCATACTPGYRRAKPITVSETGRLHRGHRSNSHRRSAAPEETTAHVLQRALWRAGVMRRARFTGGHTIVKDYVRRAEAGRGKRCSCRSRIRRGDAHGRPSAKPCVGCIDGVECKAHYLVVDLPHSDDAFVQAFPARDDGGVLRRTQRRDLRYFGWRAAWHRLRQHHAGGGEDSRGRHAAANAELQRAPLALLVRRSLRTAGEGQRQRSRWKRLVGYVYTETSSLPVPRVATLGRVER